jgi:aryl-alcohol dehydrogenase-like predicted oxidoreductase
LKSRRLGRTGLHVSEIGLGGAWLLGQGGALPQEDGIATIRHALACGLTLLDTSECYIGGRSEPLYGAALRDYAGDYVLSTKCGHRPKDFDWSRDAVLASLEESLRLLGVPRVHLFQLHTWMPDGIPTDLIFGPGGALEGMREARERGWCGALGITGQNLDFLRRCIDSDAFDALLLHDRYDLLEQTGADLIREAAAHDMGVILGSPLRVGLFGSRRDAALERYAPEQRERIYALEREHADAPGGITGAAFRFALGPQGVSAVLCGASSPAEIENAVEATEATTQ